MRVAVANILDGMSSIVAGRRSEDEIHARLLQRMGEVVDNRPGDSEMVMLDLRRALLRFADTMPPDERETIRRELDAERPPEFERRIGLAAGSNGRNGSG